MLLWSKGVTNMKKKVERLNASVSVSRVLYEADENIKAQMINEIGFNIGKYIVENKDELPIRFREVKNEYSVTLMGEVVMVDSELRHIIELIMNSDDLIEIMHCIEMYKKEKVSHER